MPHCHQKGNTSLALPDPLPCSQTQAVLPPSLVGGWVVSHPVPSHPVPTHPERLLRLSSAGLASASSPCGDIPKHCHVLDRKSVV